MNKLLSFLLFSLFVSNILCDVVNYGATCDGESTTCKATVQTCDGTSKKCVCADTYVENKDGDDCETPEDYGGDCTSKNCADTQTCDDTSSTCVCATGYKENSKKDGCEQDTSASGSGSGSGSGNSSSFLKTSLLILLGIAF